MDIADRFLHLILSHRYQLTEHAIEAMDEDNLTLNDIVACLAGGYVRRSWKRARKYEIEGYAVDARLIRIIGRLLSPRLVRIITVYEVQ